MRLGSGTFRIIRSPVPDDAVLKFTSIDPMSGLIQLFIESQQFEEIPEGSIPPIYEGLSVQRLQEG